MPKKKATDNTDKKGYKKGSDCDDFKNEDQLPFPETGLSPALQRTIKEKLDRGELDEIDMAEFEKNLRKVVKRPINYEKSVTCNILIS